MRIVINMLNARLCCIGIDGTWTGCKADVLTSSLNDWLDFCTNKHNYLTVCCVFFCSCMYHVHKAFKVVLVYRYTGIL